MYDKLLSILLVEDTLAEAELIEELLDEVIPDRFKITTVKRLTQAFEQLTAAEFNIILLDLSLPDSRGIDTIAQMKEKAFNLPIIVLTSLDDSDTALEAVRRGAQDYLVKGNFAGELLIRAIHYGIERHSIETRLRQQAERERLMARMVERIRNSLDLTVILQNTVQEVRQFLQTDRVCIYQFQSKRANSIAAESVCSNNRSERIIQPSSLELENLDAIADRLIKTILIVPIWKTDTKQKNHYPLKKTHKQLWGQLVANNYNKSREWQEWEIEFLKQLATQVAVAIQQSELYLRLQELATLDGLTQIANRRHFNDTLNLEWNRLAREQKPLSLILCDVDHFKLYNDTNGHPSGDLCLQLVAKEIARSVKRSSDLVARYGGEEFAVILPDTNIEGATYVAMQIREQIEKLQIPHLNSPTMPHVTASFGVSTMIPSLNLPPNHLIEAADRALFQAKGNGRNQVVQIT
ncbi:MAG: diguanylate cyclase [Prochloraceae cyanobacterium]|nr:diguanylate cyclase [Prochloraceae cyanobacterium]